MEVDQDASAIQPEKSASKSKSKTKLKDVPPSPGKKAAKEEKKTGEAAVVPVVENLDGATTGEGPDDGVMDVDDSAEVPAVAESAPPTVEATDKKGKKRKVEEVAPPKPKKSKKAKTS